MEELIISVSGLRGVVGETLTPDVAARFARAYAAGQPRGAIVLSSDGRSTGPMLVDSIRGSLLGMGRAVIDVGVAATPTVGVLLREHAAAGAIQVSASHNPPPYNGIKLFSQSGQVLSAADGEKVLERFHAGTTRWAKYDELGHATSLEDTLSRHVARVLATVDVELIRKQAYRVLLDSNHGAGSLLGKRLLDELGCRASIVGEPPNGCFAHPPEPTAENLAGVCKFVTDVSADIGFCQDPDADRLAVIDADGRYVGEEYTLVLCLDQVLRQRTGPVVTNCSTSRMAQDLATRYGVPFYRAAVGEANVVQMMKDNEAVFGGEGNGGPIDPEVGYIRDSFVGMAWILHAMARRQMLVGQLVDELPKYAICKTTQKLDKSKLDQALTALARHFSAAEPDRLDGLRLDWSSQWLLIRASNTEPIVRIVAETTSPAQSRSLCDEAAQVIAQV